MKLYGFAVSNYFNMVKHVLLLKGVEFEEVTVFPGADPDYLAKSPMGKVPCLETDQGCLAETSVILEYLEQTHPEPALLPSSPWALAKTREFMKMVELYIELSSRRLLPALLAGAPVSDDTKNEVRAVMEKGVAALRQLGSFQPYALGEQLSLADIFLRYSLVPAKMAAHSLLDWDLLADVPGLAEWEVRMAAEPIAQQLDSAMQEQLAAFMDGMKAKAGAQ